VIRVAEFHIKNSVSLHSMPLYQQRPIACSQGTLLMHYSFSVRATWTTDQSLLI